MYSETDNLIEVSPDLSAGADILYTEGGGLPSPGPVALPQRTEGLDVTGTVIDSKTLAPIVAKGELYNKNSGEVYATWENSQYHVWVTDDIDNVYISFSAKGYRSSDIQVSLLDGVSEIALHKSNNTILIGAAVVALVVFATKKKKSVGAVTIKDVTPFMLIGGGLIAFSLVKKVLEALGLWTSKDTKELDQAAQDSANFWSPTFWQTVKPAGAAWTYAITEATAHDWCEEINNAFGAFNDCEECAIAVFKRCRTQANASFLSYIFSLDYGEDLLAFLRGGWWPQDRLSDSDVNSINNYLNSLPKY